MGREPPAPSSAPTPPGARVLVVEDDQAIREWLSDALADEGYTVEAAGTGREALTRLARDGAPPPALILLDLKMPDLDGWAFRAAQLADPALAPIPVVVMTAATAPCDPQQGVPAATTLQKPFDLDVLLDTVARCLRRSPWD